MAGVETLWSKAELQNGGLPVPHLPILDTAEMIDAMGEGEWRALSPEEIKGRICFSIPPRPDFRETIEPWIEFCNDVIEGRRIIRSLMRRGELKLNFVALGAFNYAMRFLGGNVEERTKQIEAAKRAFSALLGRKEMRGMRPEDPNEARKLVSTFENLVLASSTF